MLLWDEGQGDSGWFPRHSMVLNNIPPAFDDGRNYVNIILAQNPLSYICVHQYKWALNRSETLFCTAGQSPEPKEWGWRARRIQTNLIPQLNAYHANSFSHAIDQGSALRTEKIV